MSHSDYSRRLHEAHSQLARADYALATAADRLKELERPVWEREAVTLMQRCIALRDQIRDAERL